MRWYGSAFKLRLHCSRASQLQPQLWDGSCARRCCHTALQFVCARGLCRSTPWVRCCNAYLVVARPCVAGVPVQRVCGGLAIVTQSNALSTFTSRLKPQPQLLYVAGALVTTLVTASRIIASLIHGCTLPSVAARAGPRSKPTRLRCSCDRDAVEYTLEFYFVQVYARGTCMRASGRACVRAL